MCITMWDLLLPEAVRNCFLGFVQTYSPLMDLLIHLCINECMLVLGSLKIRQTYFHHIAMCRLHLTCHAAVHSVLALGASSSGFLDNHSKEIALTCNLSLLRSQDATM